MFNLKSISFTCKNYAILLFHFLIYHFFTVKFDLLFSLTKVMGCKIFIHVPCVFDLIKKTRNVYGVMSVVIDLTVLIEFICNIIDLIFYYCL